MLRWTRTTNNTEGTMRIMHDLPKAIFCLFGALSAAGMATAQQVTGVPGSPSATTTLQGDQLPPPPQKFGGVIKDTAQQSKPYWPARVVPPKGAPNVLLMITDDAGFAVSGTFGGVIPTPALDRIALNGLRYTNRSEERRVGKDCQATGTP